MKADSRANGAVAMAFLYVLVGNNWEGNCLVNWMPQLPAHGFSVSRREMSEAAVWKPNLTTS